MNGSERPIVVLCVLSCLAIMSVENHLAAHGLSASRIDMFKIKQDRQLLTESSRNSLAVVSPIHHRLTSLFF